MAPPHAGQGDPPGFLFARMPERNLVCAVACHIRRQPQQTLACPALGLRITIGTPQLMLCVIGCLLPGMLAPGEEKGAYEHPADHAVDAWKAVERQRNPFARQCMARESTGRRRFLATHDR